MTELDARLEAAALCQRLRARGDRDSLEAAATIEGTLDAFADLVTERGTMREEMAELKRNLGGVRELWARVPADVRDRVVHGVQR